MDGDNSTQQTSGVSLPMILLCLFAVLVATTLWKTDTSAGKPPVPLGTAYPEFQPEGWLNAPDGDSGSFDLNAAIAAGDVVFVDCMASWCGPCLAEMPRIVEAANAYRPLGVQFVSLSMETERDVQKLKDFLAASPGADWPLAYGCVDFFNELGIQSIPTFMIFVDGKVSWSGYGGSKFTDALDAAVAQKRSRQ